jgi:hypothetical protein
LFNAWEIEDLEENMRTFFSRLLLLGMCLAINLVCFEELALGESGTNLPSKWLQSAGPVMKLGIWAKNDTLTSYEATFIVTAPNGKQYKASKHVSIDWGEVLFPDEFQPKIYAGRGRFSWKCVVRDNVVGQGAFLFNGTEAKSLD